jgi:glutamine cyclotransferase
MIYIFIRSFFLTLLLATLPGYTHAKVSSSAVTVAQCGSSLGFIKTKAPANSASPEYGYQVVNSYPHDPQAFTQGLIFNDDFLYESTGKRGKSTLRKVELETGNVLQRYSLPGRYFGEGLTLWKGKLIQLTWQERIGFVYDKKTFKLLHKFLYSMEGWGITHNDRYLIMSDGTSALYFLDPQNFQLIRSIQVHDNAIPIVNLNELEYVKDEIYANIWLTDYIARISPETGQVLGWINLETLLNQGKYTTSADVLNGIAYDKKQNRLFVTGKYWPNLFEIKLITESH